MKQTIREVITGEVSLEYLAKRLAEGWKIAIIEWSREATETGTSVASPTLLNQKTALPYGFQLTGDGLIEENPLEATVLLIILEQIIREKRIQEIARELNQQGYSTREGTPWGPTDVFNLMPRLIEAGPSLLKSAAWQQRRPTASPHNPPAGD
ncbi:MAG: recombinase family protein [Acidobacteriia bacterium]|nr:recombinase family protein [Terriglobia bacterium]